MVVIDNNGKYAHIPVFNKAEVFDVTGAGAVSYTHLTQKADIDRTNSEKAIFEKVTGDAKVEIQQSMIDREADQLAEEYKQKLSMQGFSWDQAVEAQGYDNIMNSLKEDRCV